MADLKKKIGTMVPWDQKVVHAGELASMHYIAGLMANDYPGYHLSQIPLFDSNIRYTHVVTTNGLAQWVELGRPIDDTALKHSEEVQPLPYDTLLEAIIGTVANHGYVIVTSEDGGRDHILTYTEVIRELAST